MRHTTWSPSRLASYEECPRKCRLVSLDKLCPRCFKGRLSGGYDAPAVCDTCKASIEPAPPLKRGTEMHAELEVYIDGGTHVPTIRHPSILQLVNSLRERGARTEEDICLDAQWKPVGKFDPKAWLRTKLDVLEDEGSGLWSVIDWKSGGIDKKTGEVRDSPKYLDQLELYCVAVLSKYQSAKAVSSSLIFLDARPDKDPEVMGPVVERDELPGLQKKWMGRVLPLLSDEDHVPRPNGLCRFCEFSKDRGGPCPVA
jgi:hypothetical protein